MGITESLRFPVLFVSVFWLVKVVETYFGLNFHALGIYPGAAKGIWGIFFAPFIHGNFAHLSSNTPTFVVLCAGIFFFYPHIAVRVILLIYFFTNFGVWLLARQSAYHIGASGIIYGFAGFLFFSGLFRREVKMLAISCLVVLFYGGMLYGIFPKETQISWESHLIGLLVGANFAFFFRKVRRAPLSDSPAEADDDATSALGYQNLENKHFRYVYKKKNTDKSAH